MSEQSALVERRLRRAVLIPLTVALIGTLIFLGIIQRLLGETEALRHSEEVIATAEQIRQLAVDMETGVRGYLLTHDQRFLAPRSRAVAELPRLLQRLRRLIHDNPSQTLRVAAIAQDIEAWRQFADETIESPGTNANLYDGKVLMDRVRADHDRFLSAEQALSEHRGERVHDATIAAIALTIVVAGIAGSILVFFIRRQLHEVRIAYERALTAAEESARAKDRMLATVSHELRTPLTSILGWTALMRTENFDPELQPMALTSIEQSARLQARLVEDLLDVSRMAAGKLRLEVAPIDAAEALAAAVETMQPAADAKGVAVAVTAVGDMKMMGDATRLQQVFWNLINNAVRFTPAGGRIDIHGSGQEDAVVVRVADSGIGIERSFLPHVFEPFAQQNASARASSGLGLGLDIARQIVELHGGTIRAKSEGTGRGAEFEVRLPRKSVAQP